MRAPERTFKRARQLRRNLTLPEVLLWRVLRNRQLDGLRFRRQHPIGPYVLDFYCPLAKLAVEIDGAVHDNPNQGARDVRRDAWLSQQGISSLRFTASDVLSETRRHDVEATIVAQARARTLSTALYALPLANPVDFDILSASTGQGSSPAQRGRGTAEGGGGGERRRREPVDTEVCHLPRTDVSEGASASAPPSTPSTASHAVPLPRFKGEDAARAPVRFGLPERRDS